MKYLLQIYPGSSMEEFERLPADEQQAIVDEYLALGQSPGVLGGEQLQPVETATTVRVENGETLLTDGPFVDAKEHLGGYLPGRGGRSRCGARARRADPGRADGRRGRGAAAGGAVGAARAGLPRRVGPRPRQPGRLPRRLRSRRGSRAGGVRGRRRALAARRHAAQSGRVADDHGPQPRDRPPAPRPHARREDAPARGARGRGGRDGGDDLPRRAAGADLHLLPSGARCSRRRSR